jgi:hypothetical protein
MAEQEKVFATSTLIEIKVMTPDGIVPVELRWPSDEEWSKRNGKRKILIRQLGRGMSETIPPDPSEADIDLYKTIAVNGAPPLTAPEAARILEAISLAEVVDVTLNGLDAMVELRVVSGTVHHHLKVPTTDQIFAWRRAAVHSLDLPYNVRQLKVTTEPGARLWDACSGSSEDYEGPVPAIHKDHAIRGLVEHMERALAPQGNEANF